MVAEQHQGVLGDIVAGRGELRVDQGHVAVRRREGDAVFQLLQVGFQGGNQGLVLIFTLLLPGDQGPQIAAQAGRALRMEPGGRLGHGQEDGLLNVLRAPLGDGVEEAHGVQLVAPELGPDGIVAGRGVDVQDTAPDGELAHALHQGGAGVARRREPLGQVVETVGRAGFQPDGGGEQDGPWHGPQAQSVQGCHQQGRFALGQVVELPQALLLPAPGDHGGVVEGQLPGGEDGGRLAQERGQLPLEPLGGHVVLADHQDGPLGVPDQRGHHMAAGQLPHAGQRRHLPRVHSRTELFIFRKSRKGGKKKIHEVTPVQNRTQFAAPL